MAQHVTTVILKNMPIGIDVLAQAADLIKDNLNFFEGDNLYREEGQRVYWCVIGTIIPGLFNRAASALKEFADQKHAGFETRFSNKGLGLDKVVQYAVLRQEPLPEGFFATIEQVSKNLDKPISMLSTAQTLAEQRRENLSKTEETEFALIRSAYLAELNELIVQQALRASLNVGAGLLDDLDGANRSPLVQGVTDGEGFAAPLRLKIRLTDANGAAGAAA